MNVATLGVSAYASWSQRLVNNHVIRLYEIYQSPEKLYLVLERAPCGSLEEFLYLRGRMSELGAKRVTRQLLDGLAYLHKVGVVHCDLKPANILFSDIDQGAEALSAEDSNSVKERGDKPVVPRARASSPPTSLRGLVVKICDFGHTRKVPDCRYYKFTGDINKIPFHMFKHTGTEGFVAPEVLVQEPYGKAADMWWVAVMGVIGPDASRGRAVCLASVWPPCDCHYACFRCLFRFW